MENIEQKIQSVYKFIVDYVDENGFPPSVREICSKCNVKSTASAYYYIEKLKNQGLLVKNPSKKRAITVAHTKKDYSTVPLIGTITAGKPILAVENLDGYIPLPADFSETEDLFALRVSGNSMINAGIFDKDIIIVKRCDDAENGEIIVALIDDSVTVKRLYKKIDHVILHPENDTMQDMIYDDVKILGIVKGLLRKF